MIGPGGFMAGPSEDPQREGERAAYDARLRAVGAALSWLREQADDSHEAGNDTAAWDWLIKKLDKERAKMETPNGGELSRAEGVGSNVLLGADAPERN